MTSSSLNTEQKNLSSINGFVCTCVRIFAAIPPLYILYCILHSTRAVNFDYYHNIITIFSEDGRFQWRGIFAPGNEHYMVVAKSLYAVNALVFRGDNIILALMAFGLVVISFCVLWLNAVALLKTDSARSIALVVISFFAFTTHSIHAFVLGQSGPIWFSTNLFVLLALFSLRFSSSIAPLALGLIASFCSGAGIGVWFALIVSEWTVARRSKRFWVFVGCTLLFCLVFKLYLYRLPDHHPRAAFDIVGIAFTFLAYLGGALTNNLDLAVVFGGIGVLLGGTLVYGTLRRNISALEGFWFGVAAYAIAAAGLTALARAGFENLEMALSSRYATIPALYWISLAVITLYRDSGAQKGLFVASVACLGFLLGYPDVRAYQKMTQELEVASVVVALGHPPLDSFRLPTVGEQERAQLIKTYRSLGHYPFNSNFPYGCGLLGKSINANKILKNHLVTGYLDSVGTSDAPEVVRTSGWAHSRAGEIECVIIVDESNVVRGAAVYGFPRLDVNIALEIAGGDFGFDGFAESRSLEGDSKLHALVKLRSNDSFYQLQ